MLPNIHDALEIADHPLFLSAPNLLSALFSICPSDLQTEAYLSFVEWGFWKEDQKQPSTGQSGPLEEQ